MENLSLYKGEDSVNTANVSNSFRYLWLYRCNLI